MLKMIQNSTNKIKSSNKVIFYLAAFGLIYILWNCSTFFHSATTAPSLDFSWMIGLNWASLLKFKWLGDNVVFTYGPLYYLGGLLLPEFHSKSTIILTVIGLNLFYAACFTYIYSCFFNLRFEQKWKWIVLLVVAVLLVFQGSDTNLVPLFTAFIFVPIIFSSDANTKKARIERYVRYGIIALFLAVIPFIKLSHIYESLVFIVIMMGFSVYRRKYLEAVIIGALFSVFTIVIWVLTTGETSLFLLPAYFASRLSMSSGYTEAMMINSRGENSPKVFIFALFVFISLTSAFVYLLFTRKWAWAVAWLFPIISLFLGFKNSFVRADDSHSHIFLACIILSVLYYFYLLVQMNMDAEKEPSRPSRVVFLVRVMMPILAIILFSIFPLGIKISPTGQFPAIIKLFEPKRYSKIDQQNIAARYKAAYKKYFHLDTAFLGHIDSKKTVDIIPWDIALLYAYDLRWTPRPVLQSYASYTSSLDTIDADFFRKPDSPSQLIFSLLQIGGHSPVFGTPNTFRALLDNYKFVTYTTNKKYILLEKKKVPLSRDFVLISQKTFHLNEKIPIPNVQEGHVFMAAKIEPTLLGKFLDIAYKPTSFLVVEITLNTGQKIGYRLIRDTAQNGLFVSKYIRTMGDLQSVFNETYSQNITSIRFTGDTTIYSDLIRVNFYKIPFQP